MEQELTETFEREQGRLLSWMSRRLDREEAEDALQDILVRTLINLDSLEGVRDITTWIWRSARNAVIDSWRKRQRRRGAGEVAAPENLDELVDRSLKGAYQVLEERELLGDLAEALRRLPAEQREVILAQCLEGETFQAISDRTGISADTLAARKRYALARLRRTLREYGWEDA